MTLIASKRLMQTFPLKKATQITLPKNRLETALPLVFANINFLPCFLEDATPIAECRKFFSFQHRTRQHFSTTVRHSKSFPRSIRPDCFSPPPVGRIVPTTSPYWPLLLIPPPPSRLPVPQFPAHKQLLVILQHIFC